jgi:hypothetical protein
MEIKTKTQVEAEKRIKEVIMSMNVLNEREFTEKYMFNHNFQKGIDKLVRLFMEAKFNSKY